MCGISDRCVADLASVVLQDCERAEKDRGKHNAPVAVIGGTKARTPIGSYVSTYRLASQNKNKSLIF